MPRVKLEPLNHYGFSMTLPARTTDLNSADHLAAYALVGMLDEVYARFIRQLKLEKPGQYVATNYLGNWVSNHLI